MIIICGRFNLQSITGKVALRLTGRFELGSLQMTLDTGDIETGESLIDAAWKSGYGIGISRLNHEKRFVCLTVCGPIAHPCIYNGVYNDKEILDSVQTALEKVAERIPGVCFHDMELFHLEKTDYSYL